MGVGRRRPTAKPYLDALEANQAIDAGSGLTSLAGLPHGEFGVQAEPHRGDTCHLESGRPSIIVNIEPSDCLAMLTVSSPGTARAPMCNGCCRNWRPIWGHIVTHISAPHDPLRGGGWTQNR